MKNISTLSFGNIVRAWQIDKIIIATAVTCLAPLVVHALPIPAAKSLGAIWLPIFYAPLLAVLLFRPHVALVAALVAPTINQLLFNVPELFMARMLTLELFVFVSVLTLIRSKAEIKIWHPIAAYILASLVTWIFGFAGGHSAFAVSMIQAIPGMIILGLIAFFVSKVRGK